jgi:PAS domain S-box-containing protein
MNPPLRVLHLEDDSQDAELMRATLEAEGIQAELTRVETEQDFVAAIKEKDVDLILADYSLPSFDGLSALKIAREHATDVPFIFVSGKLGEDVAIEALKTGATDYVLKTHLVRLAPAVNRALREALEKAERKRAQEALHQSEKQLRDLVEMMPAMAFVSQPDGSSEFISRGWIEFSGLSKEQTMGSGWAAALHPDDAAQHLAKWRACHASGESFESEARHRDAHGNYRWLLVRAVPLKDQQGNILKWYGAITDIEDRKQAEALLAGEKRILEMIATGVSLKEILNSLCLIIEQQRSGTIASVLLLNSDGVHLDFAAGAKLPNEWTRQMEKMSIGPSAGSCGTAAYRGASVIVSDIATDPLWDVPEHRASALKHGLRASWSSPVLSFKGKVLGTFCLYYPAPRTPTSEDLELIELATHLVRVAIERDRAEEALRTSEQLARTHVEVMMRSLDVLATEATPEKFVAEILRTIGQRLHASSVLLWLRDQRDDALRLQLVIENDQQIAPHPDHPFVKDPTAWKRSPYFQEMFFTKGPVLCDDIEHDPRIGADFRKYLMKRGRRKFMAVPMFVLGEVRGFIGIQHAEGGTYRPDEVELAQALAHHVMMAAHGAELAEQRRHAALLEERTRMARDIHDTLAQGFTGVIVQLEAAEDALGCGFRKDTNKHIQRAGELARRSLSEARRSVHALRPQALQEHNFWDALKGTIKNTAAGTTLRTTFQAKGKIPDLPHPWQDNLLRIGQEALSNTLKYGHASHFDTRLSYRANKLRLELRDDGDGFKPKDRHDGVGLTGMHERVEQMGGELEIISSPGKGTKITVVLPCNGESLV